MRKYILYAIYAILLCLLPVAMGISIGIRTAAITCGDFAVGERVIVRNKYDEAQQDGTIEFFSADCKLCKVQTGTWDHRNSEWVPLERLTKIKK